MQISKDYFLHWVKTKGCFNFKNGWQLWKQGKKVMLTNFDLDYVIHFSNIEDAYENGMMGDVSIKDFLNDADDDILMGYLSIA